MRKKLLELLNRYDSYGYMEDSYSIKIGRAPHIAELAWMHAVYNPLSLEEINLFETEVDFTIPGVYRTFLTQMNGCSIFTHSISLFGYRKALSRSVEMAYSFPFSLSNPNLLERNGLAGNYFVIGSYRKDGSKVVIDLKDNTVKRLDKRDFVVYNIWPDLENFLFNEIERMIDCAENNGILKKGFMGRLGEKSSFPPPM